MAEQEDIRKPVRQRVESGLPAGQAGGEETARQRQLGDLLNGRVSNYAELEDYLTERINEYKGESDADKARRERREKRDMFLAGIGDVLGSMHKSYSYQRGVEPMALPDLSAKSRERIDKARAAREKEGDRQMNYLNMLGKVRDLREQLDLRKSRLEVDRKKNETQARNVARLEAKGESDELEREWRRDLAENKFEYQQEKDRLDRELRERRISLEEYKAATARLRAVESERQGAYNRQPVTVESTTTSDNGFGGVKTSRTTRTTSRGGASQGGNGGASQGGGQGNNGKKLKPNKLGL